MREGLSRVESTSKTSIEIIFDTVFLLVEVVHNGGEDGRLDFSHLGSRIFLS